MHPLSSSGIARSTRDDVVHDRWRVRTIPRENGRRLDAAPPPHRSQSTPWLGRPIRMTPEVLRRVPDRANLQLVRVVDDICIKSRNAVRARKMIDAGDIHEERIEAQPCA